MTKEDIIRMAREAGVISTKIDGIERFVALVAAAERKSKPHSLGPGEMELYLRREHKGELFESRYRFTHLEVMNKAEFLVKDIARKLDVEMNHAIRARGQA